MNWSCRKICIEAKPAESNPPRNSPLKLFETMIDFEARGILVDRSDESLSVEYMVYGFSVYSFTLRPIIVRVRV